MTQPSTTAIGIDLGTTFSVLARIDERGQPVTVVNAEGDRLTPSVVLFEGDDVVVGKEALKAIVTEAQHVAECSKRDVGHRVYHKVLEGKQYPPEVIEALILNKLRVDAEKQIGPIDKAVITVPAYFDEVRRKATQDSGYMAGFEVLDIINEPTAAAVAFGFQQGYLDAEGGTVEPQNILVYDLGGGTFDVTVMQIRGTEFNALADRRRRPPGRLRLGPAAGRPGRGELHPPASGRPARRPGIGGQTVAGVRGRQADPLGPAEGRRGLRPSRRYRADRDRSAAVRGGHAGPVGPHAVHHRPSLAGGGTGLEGPQSRAVGGRVHPDADGPRDAPPAFRQAARRLGGRRRGGGPRRRPARLADPGPAGRSAGRLQDQERQLAQSGRGGHRVVDQAPPQRHPHSPQHAAAGHRQANLQDDQGRPALDPRRDRRGGKPLGRRLHAGGPLLGASLAAGPARPVLRWKFSSTTSRTGG